MKKIIIMLALVTSFNINYAQIVNTSEHIQKTDKDIAFGVTLGGNLAGQTIEETNNASNKTSLKTGLQGGVFFEFRETPKLKGHIALLLAEKGGKLETTVSIGGHSNTTKLSYPRLYFQLNTIEKYYLSDKIYLAMGPYLAYGWKARNKYIDNNSLKDAYKGENHEKRFDCGGVFGCGLDFGTRFFVEGDLTYGFLNLSGDDNSPKTHNYTMTILFGFKF